MNGENVTGEITEIRESLSVIAGSLAKLDRFINHFDLVDCLELSEKELLKIFTLGKTNLKLFCKVKSEGIQFYGKRMNSGSNNVYWDDVRSVSSEERFWVVKFFSFAPFESYGEHVLVSGGVESGLIEFDSLEFYLIKD